MVSGIDTVDPVIAFNISGTNSASITCSDADSGVVSAGETWQLSGTSNITKEYTCTDLAGNSVTGSHTYTYSSCVTGANTCSYGCDSTYNSCISGSSNTCVGANVTDYNNCTQYKCVLWKRCTTAQVTGICTNNGTKTGDCYTKNGSVTEQLAICNTTCSNWCGSSYSHSCTVQGATTSGRQQACGSETVYGSACNNASNKTCTTYGTKYDSCASTTNTCQGGYVQSNCSSCKTGSNTCRAGFKY